MSKLSISNSIQSLISLGLMIACMYTIIGENINEEQKNNKYFFII